MSDNTALPGTGEVVADEDINGVKYQRIKLTDARQGHTEPTGVSSNPLMVSDDSVVLLRRIVKLLESQAATDSAQRAKVTIDNITGSLTLTTLTGITNALPAGTNTLGNVTVGGMDNKQFIDISRNAYANAIRSKLIFS